MPLYDYRCHRCGEVFEVRQKFADPLLTEHEACGGELERLISAPALQFKGTGWYVTDYAKKGAASAGSPSSSSEGDSATKEAKDSKDTKDAKDTKDTKKDEKPKSESSQKKHKKE